jgi:ADP-ribose pyrophosphatase YjhB (NUDIX family)
MSFSSELSQSQLLFERRRDLHARLLAHQGHDEEERAHVASMLELCSGPGEPFAGSHFVPGHFTASAFILSPADDALLLIFHGKLSRWLQPGGHVEASDVSILSAARREVAEEVNLVDLELAREGIFDVDVHEIPARKNDPTHRHFDVRFLFRARDLSFAAASDARAGRWVQLNEMHQVESDRSVLRAVEKLRAR